jgi:integrase
MASLYKRKDLRTGKPSEVWYAVYRVPAAFDPETGTVTAWKQRRKSTGLGDYKKAMAEAQHIENNARAAVGACEDKQTQIQAIVNRCADMARRGTLHEMAARRMVGDIYRISLGEELPFYSTRQWFAHWLGQRKSNVKGSTGSLYDIATRQFLEQLGERADATIETVRSEDIRAYRDAFLKTGRAAKTANIRLKVLRSIFKSAMDQGIILMNPCASVDTLAEQDSVERAPFTEEECRTIVQASDGDWQTAVLLGIYTGLRLTDVTNLKWGNIDLETRIIRLRPRKQRIKGRQRLLTIPIHPALGKALEGLDCSDDVTAPLFPKLAGRSPGGKGGTGSKGGLSSEFKALMKKAGVADQVLLPSPDGAGQTHAVRSFHSFRHTFVSLLTNNSVSADVRKAIAAHRDDDAHQLYAHVDVELMRSAIEGALPVLLSPSKS